MKHDDLAALELRSMRSAWKALERRWDLSPSERRALLPAGGVDEESPPRDTEARMRILIEVGYRIGLAEMLLQDWLRTSTPTLGWLTPLDVMSGTMSELRAMRRLVEMGLAS
ncbi:Protein of unknown function [Sphingomonas palmae]|uniref:Uncharacterized protein n=1 Tax=Sphingomonas palmae TaxID=1855283 RepID=A0A1H7T911_9SPHN|nr:antitoxin Xre/MbcA/ParS toxin-binding domain-containing protein [Sphingomonas palmae]SEL80854.1 Protein of unknown function [Sphingomonas palmae]